MGERGADISFYKDKIDEQNQRLLDKTGFRWAARFYVDVGGAAFFMAMGKAQQSKNKMALGQNNL